MNISRINSNNSFGAQVIGKLKEEMLRKEYSLSSANKEAELRNFLLTKKEIKKILPQLTVDINAQNDSYYRINSKIGVFLQERGKDKLPENYNYSNLIKALNYIKENYVV